VIRLATLDDIEAIVTLGARLIRSGAYSHTTISFKACVDRLTRAIRSKDEWIGVAVHDGKIVGFLIVVLAPYWWSSSGKFALDDGIYCTRPGLGRMLVQAAAEWAARRGAKEFLVAFTSRINPEHTARSAMALVARGQFKERGVVISLDPGTIVRRAKWAA
jgi:GNAT superfamily N-acetyltransferase